MRQNRLQCGPGALASAASTTAFVLLLLWIVPASADLYMVQKKYDSTEYGGKDAKAGEVAIRTWVAKDRLRQDYGDPAGFIHITRLDRRPGELISYLINMGKGGYGKTYWTFCRPYVVPLPPTSSGDPNNANANMEHAAATGVHDSLTLTDTGETKLINNFHCGKYLLKGRLTSTEFSSEIWVSMDIGSALERYGLVWGARIDRTYSELKFREASNTVEDEMRTIKGFPVLITEIEQNQYVHYERRLELLEFKEESSLPSQFDLPGGLTKKFMGAAAHPKSCED